MSSALAVMAVLGLLGPGSACLRLREDDGTPGSPFYSNEEFTFHRLAYVANSYLGSGVSEIIGHPPGGGFQSRA